LRSNTNGYSGKTH